MACQRIPPELISHILSYLDTRLGPTGMATLGLSNLLCSSLVCRAWMLVARSRIFETLEIRGYRASALAKLLLHPPCTIPRRIRRLGFRGQRMTQSATFPASAYKTIIEHFTEVGSVEFLHFEIFIPRGIRMILDGWEYVKKSSSYGLLYLNSSSRSPLSSTTCFKMLGVKFQTPGDMLQFLSCDTNGLESLHVSHVTFSDERGYIREEQSHRILKSFARLKNVNITQWLSNSKNEMSFFDVITGLPSVKLESLSVNLCHPSYHGFPPALRSFLCRKECVEQLQHIGLKYEAVGIHALRPLDLRPCQSLTSLGIVIEYNYFTFKNAPNPAPMLTAALSQLPRTLEQCTLMFYFFNDAKISSTEAARFSTYLKQVSSELRDMDRNLASLSVGGGGGGNLKELRIRYVKGSGTTTPVKVPVWDDLMPLCFTRGLLVVENTVCYYSRDECYDQISRGY